MKTEVRRTKITGLVGASLLTLLLAGCRVENHKDGDNDSVKIATPFGGMSVKTNEAVVQGNLGLSIYPGATPERKKKGDDEAADINMSFGDFHLGVKAASYLTPDSTDKVKAYYQKSLASHGAVIECQNNKTVGPVRQTQGGLTCEDGNERSIHLEEKADRGQVELKIGSKQHQHIVSIEPKDGGTKIGLVALDLPGSFAGKGDGGDTQ